MRRSFRRLVVLTISVSALVAATAVATGAQTNGVVERATGSGHFLQAGELRTFAFSAIKRADGTVTGNIVVIARAAGIVSHLKVTCLNVVGNTATMSGTIRKDTRAEYEGLAFRVTVQDNGEGENDPPDQVSLVRAPAAGFPQPPETQCLAETPVLVLRPIERGNVQVSER